MNATTTNFLKSMMEKIEAEVKASMASLVNERVSKNLATLVKEGIITKAEAESFATSNGLNVKLTTTRMAALADDGCGHGSLSRGSC